MSIKSYELTITSDGWCRVLEHTEAGHGTWARYEDAEKLQVQLAALKEENELANHAADLAERFREEWKQKAVSSAAEVDRLKDQVAELEHAANEWADACINGLQHLKNIRDGISLASVVIPNMEQCIEHCQSVWATALKEPAND